MTEEKRREEKEKENCHMLITSLLNEGAVIKRVEIYVEIFLGEPTGNDHDITCREDDFNSNNDDVNCDNDDIDWNEDGSLLWCLCQLDDNVVYCDNNVVKCDENDVACEGNDVNTQKLD